MLYRLRDYLGRQVFVLFVWTLDDAARQAIVRLDAKPRSQGETTVVVVVNPDRVAIRRLVGATPIRSPILFGDAEVANAYRITKSSVALYVITPQGMVAYRQLMTSKQ